MSSKKLVFLSVAAGTFLSATIAIFLLKSSAQKISAQPTSAHTTAARQESGSRVLSPEAKTIDKPLPDAPLTDLEGQEAPPDELRRGRYLLVFLTSGCGPCVDEANSISRMLQGGASPLRVYGVGVEKQGQVANFVKEYDFKFPFLLDKDSGLRLGLDVRIFPSKFLVEDGVVKKAWYGKAPDEAMLRSQLAMEEVK
jgi:peroxiredoxin